MPSCKRRCCILTAACCSRRTTVTLPPTSRRDSSPHALSLHEPTNDLDIYTLQILEEFLLDFPGCLIIVSHDRYFMDRLVEHIWVLGTGSEVRFFPGNYSQFRLAAADEKRQAQASREANKATVESSAAAAPPKNDYSKRLSFKEKFEFEQLEGKISELEQQKASLTEQLYANPDPAKLQVLGEKLHEVTTALEEVENRWLELSERAE